MVLKIISRTLRRSEAWFVRSSFRRVLDDIRVVLDHFTSFTSFTRVTFDHNHNSRYPDVLCHSYREPFHQEDTVDEFPYLVVPFLR